MLDVPGPPATTRPVDDETERAAKLRPWSSPRGLGRAVYWALRDEFEGVARDAKSAHRLALRGARVAYLRGALELDVPDIAAQLDVGTRTVERDLALLRALDIEGLSFDRRPRIPLTLLEDLERRARAGGRDGLAARWLFGRELLTARRGKGRLANGVLGDVCEAVGITRSEASARTAFAQRFPDEAAMWAAIDAAGGAWRRIVHEGLPTHAAGGRRTGTARAAA